LVFLAAKDPISNSFSKPKCYFIFNQNVKIENITIQDQNSRKILSSPTFDFDLKPPKVGFYLIRFYENNNNNKFKFK